MTATGSCPTDADLRAFALGTDTDPAATVVESHLAVCASCLHRLEELRATDELLMALRCPDAETPEMLAPHVETVIERLRTLGGVEEVGRLDTAQAETVSQVGPPPVGTAQSPPAFIGRYRITHVLGAGGMGTVYAAEDPALGRPVAVKVPRREWLGADPERAQARFLREVRTAARVRHVNICTVHDTGTHDGLPYVVLDLIEGSSLLDRLRQGPVEPRQAAEWVRQLAEALAAVHAAGMTHRDVKPGNVLLAPDGRAVLTDFGVARPDDAEPLTTDGHLVGTPAYMAPEQLAGAGGGPQADLYALGLVFYQMLAGRLPFDGYPSVNALPPPPSRWRPGLDPRLDAIALKALAPRPEERYAGARAMADDLARHLSQNAPAPGNRPATVRVELPDGRPVTVQVAEGVPEGGKVHVSVRERPRKKGPSRWAVSVTVTFALLFAVCLVGLNEYTRKGTTVQYGGINRQSEPPTGPAKDGAKDEDDARAQAKWEALHLKIGRVRTPRVHLSYDVENLGAELRVELPFVIGVLADLSGEPAKPRRAFKDRRFIEIDRDNFDDIMKRIAPRVVLRQPEGPPVELTFSRMQDFDPAEVAKRATPGVLSRPEYRRLESTWRGLHYLVRNTETSHQLKIRVLDVSAAEILRDAETAADLEQTVLYRKVYADEYSQFGGQPYALLVGDYEIGAADLKLLSAIGAVAERAQAPFIAAAAPSLLGATSFADLPAPMALDAGAGRTGWKEYRQSEVARWTGLALPRVVARPPAEGETEPPWMSAAWVFAVEAADAEAKYGWPARISAQAGSRVGELPLWKPGKEAPRPTDAALTPAQGFDLAGRGFLPLLPLDDKGNAAFVDAPSCRAPRPGDAADADGCRLPTLLCAGRASQTLAVMVGDKIGAFGEKDDMEKWLNRWLGGYRADGPVEPPARAKKPYADAVVQVREVPGRPGHYEMILTLRPVHELDPPPQAPLRLVVPVPKRGE